ncbi:unnamed protein product [Hydatigera taeniaeformis]|uniref:AAA domain-containing protein n=1 Tax=Hydatigena taeniaeformis TaxID=6205 RepID=A0A0R3X1H9_HYDTA|nr:unnamed protein product [Hydatigera taeniaeformis]
MRIVSCYPIHTFMFFVFVVSVGSGFDLLRKTIESAQCLFGECCSNALHFNHECRSALLHFFQIFMTLEDTTSDFSRLLQAHLEDPSPRRSLVLSLHGFTGVGKNYAVSILASSMFKAGEKSRFYRRFDATIDFLFKDSVELYKVYSLPLIQQVVSKCERSLLVFDEVHKMPSGILDALVPLLGFAESVKGVDYRKAIFSIQYGDLRRALSMSIYNEEGALKFSDLISSHVVTAAVPFLPLQEVHIRSCIVDAARRLGVEDTEAMIDFVLNELDWEPEDTHLFSSSGCKLVHEKVGFYLQQRSFGSRSTTIRDEL